MDAVYAAAKKGSDELQKALDGGADVNVQGKLSSIGAYEGGGRESPAD